MVPWATPPGGAPLHNLRDEALGHLVHRLQRGHGVLRHTIATLAEPLDQQAGLPDQPAHRGEPTRQHLALGLVALGQQMGGFDGPENRLPLHACRLAPHPRTGFELRKGAATALGPPRKRPGSWGYPIGNAGAVVSDERRLASAKPESWATCSMNALPSSTPSLPKAV